MPLSLNALRIGHTYRIENYGEQRDFTVEMRIANEDYAIKDKATREDMILSELLAYGRGKDFQLDEINDWGEII